MHKCHVYSSKFNINVWLSCVQKALNIMFKSNTCACEIQLNWTNLAERRINTECGLINNRTLHCILCWVRFLLGRGFLSGGPTRLQLAPDINSIIIINAAAYTINKHCNVVMSSAVTIISSITHGKSAIKIRKHNSRHFYFIVAAVWQCERDFKYSWAAARQACKCKAGLRRIQAGAVQSHKLHLHLMHSH